MNCIFIYNPVSGNGKISKKLDYIVTELKYKFTDVEVYATKSAGDMMKAANDAIGKFDAIVFAGGDGSFNEVLQAVAAVENPPMLGYIPFGTVNDIAHTLKIPKNVKKAVKIIKDGRCETLDCMKVNDRYAMYVVCTGAFVSASYSTSQTMKNKQGRVAYFIHGLKNNLRLEIFDVDCKDKICVQHSPSVFIAFINSRYVAGFKINNKSSLQDGKIEVVMIKQVVKPNIFQRIGALFTMAKLFLFGYNARGKRIIHMEGNAFNVEVPEGLTWNFDGEKGLHGSIHIEVVPKKVNMILPKKIKRI